MKRWMNIELTYDESRLMVKMMREEGFRFETSALDTYTDGKPDIHIEILVEQRSDLEFLNEWVSDNLF